MKDKTLLHFEIISQVKVESIYLFIIYKLFRMQSRESEDTPPFCGTDLLPWEFIIMINSKQYSLDIRSTPTLEDLNKRVEDHLLSKDKAEKKPRLLYYLDGTQKRWIKSEEDYKTYLKQRKSSNHLDLYSVQERAPLLSSFEENANRLIQTYKLKGQMCPQEVEAPQESWLQGNWLRWAQAHVDPEKYEDFRFEVDSMFSTETKQIVVYESHEMTDDLLLELESFEPEASRYDHAESRLYCILLSIYSKVAEQSGYRVGQMDKSLWKLSAWKESKTRVQSSQSAKNFHVSYQSKVVVPTIKPVSSQIKEQSSEPRNIDMFSQVKLFPEDSKLKYIALDLLHDTASRFLKNDITQEEFRGFNSLERIMSDDQVWKFVQGVAKAKAIYFGNYVHKVPTSPQDGVLLPFDDNEKIGILGDWGSGLPDAFDHLEELVLRRGATIIIHLGDVYYSGFPEEFKKISDKIKELRTKVPRLRYYTIPGNHDYYTNGGPFYDSLQNYNDDPNLQQKFGFFCLRNKSNTVQYIGLDTGYSESGLLDAINPKFEGTFISPQELAWAKEKILNFKGQTILLTHHYAYSAYESILGFLSKFGRTNNQVDTKLSEQLFEILPKVSVWYWGHEHRLSLMEPNAFGIPCTRTLGNSAFQVHKPKTYDVKYPDYNPIISKYNPGKNDDQNPTQPYFDHTGGIVTFSNDKINTQYIDMTSSYLQPSKVTRQFQQNITWPVLSEVLCNKPYRVKDASGLSFCYQNGGQYIWINYKPDDLIFEKADDPTYTGPIMSGMELYIKVAGQNRYLYLNRTSYVKAGSSKDSNNGRFKFVNRNGNSTIKTGDSLTLKNISKGTESPIGRYYYTLSKKPYYCLATGSDTEYTPVQIYDHTVSNTDLP